MAGPRSWTFERLKTTLRQSRASTVAELIQAIDIADPGFFDRWAAFHDSKSLQRASFRDPRVIAFSNDGGLMLTFNGDPSKKGYAVVEVMEFDPQKGYEFREIHFPGEGSARSFTEREVEEELGYATVSKANPAECLLCHGAISPRPVWDAYFLWPGAYGKEDDAWTVEEREQLRLNQDYWKSHSRYGKVLHRFGPQRAYEIDPIYSGERVASQPWGYRRNLMLSRLFSLQMTTLLTNELRSKPNALEGLRQCRSSFDYSSSVYTSALQRLRTLEDEYARDPNLRLASQNRTPFSTAAGESTRIETLISSFGLSVTSFVPLQRQGANFEDGGSGFRYLDRVLETVLGPQAPGPGLNCVAFWREAEARYRAQSAGSGSR